ncbi:MAG TPA: dehypoxanthine futalosine cyclase [Armatimonadetes bacterium]|nr:dehypoxanthine futalosine cyclase [Armatimonadota bacterium]
MSNLCDIERKVLAGERLTFADGVQLFHHPNLPELGALADYVRRRKHPAPIVTYNFGRNVNYTNVCWVRCAFCAFYRPPGSGEGYVLSWEEIFRKVQELVEVGGDQPGSCELLLQGGLNPQLKIEYFEELFAALKARFPQVHLHALSATEIFYLARLSRLPLEETIRRLHAAGLDSIPGGGAEILVEEVRRQISPRKETPEQWLEVHRIAHQLGLNTTATMMYGSVETLEHRIEHLLRLRALQDESLAAGRGQFTAFIPWSFQPRGTALATRRPLKKTRGVDYLRTVAVARLLLDNIENLQASYVTQGPKIAQIGLKFGLNDFGSTMMEENVVRAAGTNFLLPVEELKRLIREAGYEPRRRNTRYELLE